MALGLTLKLRLFTSRLSAVVTSGLQAWHKFTATTWSGSNRLPDSSPVATNTAALYTGRALDFDGVNDVVTVGATGATVKTVIFYANPDTTTQSFMQLQSSGAVRIQIASGTLSATGFTSPTLYVNGVASSTVAASSWQMIAVTSATGVSASNVLFGQQNTTFYSGLLSNIKFFTSELTAGQIAELYANPEQSVPTGISSADLTCWWPFSGISEGFLFNSQNKTAPISGATVASGIVSPVTQPGLVRQSSLYKFDGVDDGVSISSISLTGDFDLIFYFVTFSMSARMGLLGNNSSSSNRISVVSSTQIDWRFNGSFSVATVSLQNGVLNKVRITRSGSTVTGYLNDVSFITATDSNTFTFDRIGVLNASTSDFNGIIYSVELVGVAKWMNQNNWQDSIGTNHGTKVGGPAITLIREGLTAGSDLFGRALNNLTNGVFTPNSGYAQITDNSTLDITTAITLECWMKPFVTNTTMTLIGKQVTYLLRLASTGVVQFVKWSSSAASTTSDTTAITAGTWYHVAAVYDGANLKFYINGALSSSASVTGAIDSTSNDLLIGARTSTSELFSGQLDSVKVYNAALTAAQVAGNYAAEVSNYQ